MAVKPQQFLSDWFDKTAETTEAALATTAKYQEQSMKWWAEVLGSNAGTPQEWPKHMRQIASEVLPAARKSAEEYVQAMGELYEKEMEILRASIESSQQYAIPPARIQDFWENMFGALRTNAQNLIRANCSAMECWAELVRKSEVAKPPSPPQ